MPGMPKSLPTFCDAMRPRRNPGTCAREKQDKEEEQEREALAKSSRDQ